MSDFIISILLSGGDSLYNRIISLLTAFAITFSICSVPASASLVEEDVSSTVVSYWDQFLANTAHFWNGVDIGIDDLGIPVGSMVGHLCGSLSSNLCPNTDDHLHSGHYILSGLQSDSAGSYYLVECDYCGANFKYYSNDLATDYDDYVHGVEKDWGTTVYSPTHYILPVVYDSFSCSNTSRKPTPVYSFSHNHFHSTVVPPAGASSFSYSYVYPTVKFSYTVPFDCYVYWSGASNFSSVFLSSSGSSYTFTPDCSDSGSYTYFPSGSSSFIQVRYSRNPNDTSSLGYIDISFDIGDLYAIPVDVYGGAPFDPDVYYPGSVPTTRPVSFVTNNYDIDNSTTVNNNFINETNNTYTTNTGESYAINNWTYDYSARSYNVTYNIDESTTQNVQITYGDEFITVVDNGITNYYYYGINSTDPETPVDTEPPVETETPGETESPVETTPSTGDTNINIDYSPVLVDIQNNITALLAAVGVLDSDIQIVNDWLVDISQNNKQTYEKLLTTYNMLNSTLNFTSSTGDSYTQAQLSFYIYDYLKNQLGVDIDNGLVNLDEIVELLTDLNNKMDVNNDYLQQILDALNNGSGSPGGNGSPGAGNWLSNLFDTLTDAISDFFSFIWDLILQILKAIASSLVKAVTWVFSFFTGQAVSGISDLTDAYKDGSDLFGLFNGADVMAYDGDISASSSVTSDASLPGDSISDSSVGGSTNGS